MVATVSDTGQFKSGRQFAAWLGLVPKQNSSGDKVRLGGSDPRCPQQVDTDGGVAEQSFEEKACAAGLGGARQQNGAHRLGAPGEGATFQPLQDQRSLTETHGYTIIGDGRK